MKKFVILFADNDHSFLDIRRQFLEDAGYSVIPVYTEEEARRQLRENQEIDLAILDIRLVEDKDDKDLSGLEIAREEARQTPKIILTSFPNVDNTRMALKVLSDGLPPAVEFVDKEEGPKALLKAIRYALGPDTAWMRNVKNSIDQNDVMINDDYKSTRRQSWIYFVSSLISAMIGIAILFFGIVLAFFQGQKGFTFSQQITIGLLSAAASIIMEAVSVLFFRRADAANQRMDLYHQERLQGQRYKILLDTCNSITSSTDQEACCIRIIQVASDSWLNHQLPEYKEG